MTDFEKLLEAYGNAAFALGQLRMDRVALRIDHQIARAKLEAAKQAVIDAYQEKEKQ